MRPTIAISLSFALAIGFSASTVFAQEIVHAAAGKLTNIDAAKHTITIQSVGGGQSVFRDETKQHPDLEFDKRLREQAIDTSHFNKIGDQVVVYYFGEGSQQTAVALKDIGPKSLQVLTGEVENVKHREMTLKPDGGSPETINLASNATVDTPTGAVEGHEFTPRKGDRLTVEYASGGSAPTALFIAED